MSLQNRDGIWHYRFKFHGTPYRRTTGLAATPQNKRAAQGKENEHFQRLKDGRQPSREIVVREFNDAAKQFLGWAETEYRRHPNSYKRIKTSFASARAFFDRKPVSMLDEGEIESYKSWRITKHEVRDITLRHDLHALSTFFGYAIKQRWARENPLRNVEIPSDKEAVRMHILTTAEEKLYFERAAADCDLHDLGRLIILQGTRPEEVTSLAKCDVDLDLGQLQVVRGKTPAARRTLTLTTESRRILAARMEGDSPWVFPAKRNPGRHITRLNSAHDRLCHRAKADGILFNFVLYDFRHTFATRRATATQGDRFDLASLAAILGHSSLRMIQKYVHPTAEHQRALMQKYDATLQAEELQAQGNDGVMVN
jgi:integrase